MTLSDNCVALVKMSEGCRLDAYADSGGVWTIGYGHTGADVCSGLVWDEQQCEAALRCDLEAAGEAVSRLVKVPLTQGQFDALTDFVFNMGAHRLQASSLLFALNAGRYNAVPDQLCHLDAETGEWHGWVLDDGKVLPGLVTRRQNEIKLWNGETL